MDLFTDLLPQDNINDDVGSNDEQMENLLNNVEQNVQENSSSVSSNNLLPARRSKNNNLINQITGIYKFFF